MQFSFINLHDLDILYEWLLWMYMFYTNVYIWGIYMFFVIIKKTSYIKINIFNLGAIKGTWKKILKYFKHQNSYQPKFKKYRKTETSHTCYSVILWIDQKFNQSEACSL